MLATFFFFFLWFPHYCHLCCVRFCDALFVLCAIRPFFYKVRRQVSFISFSGALPAFPVSYH